MNSAKNVEPKHHLHRAIDAAEEIVGQYLKSKDYGTVRHEPDGKVPPDFLVGTRIAVEVTRLNIHCDDDGVKTYAHQQHLMPVIQGLTKMLLEFGGPVNDESWFVYFALLHPFKGWPEIRAAVKSKLDSFRTGINRENCSITVAEAIEIQLCRAHAQVDTFFVYAGGSEDFQGCIALSEMHRNIQIAVDSKWRKIEVHKEKYDQWWLALVDLIGFGTSGEDFEQLLSMPLNRCNWDKILLVNPQDPAQAYEF